METAACASTEKGEVGVARTDFKLSLPSGLKAPWSRRALLPALF